MSISRRKFSDISNGRLGTIDETPDERLLVPRTQRRASIISHTGLNRRKWRKGSVGSDGNGQPRGGKVTTQSLESLEFDDKRKISRSKQLKQRKALLAKFRLVGRLAVFCVRQAREHRLKDKLYDEIMPYVNEMQFHDYEKDEGQVVDGLSFDPSTFKADKQLRMSEETKRVLSLRPRDRTAKDLTYAQLALRNIESIAEYPMRMQRKIVEVGTYEKYDAKRVIVRQGHPASAFYIILSGSVVVMVTDPETKVAKPVAYLPKGKPFGELAIMKRTIRHASIIAKETLELLSIDIRDFHRIFMAGGHKNINDPDHNDFIRNIGFLRGWPVERMGTDPEKCQFFYFKRGDIVVRDSQNSKWLFIVKSGSLNVMKKLKRVRAFEWQKKESTEENGQLPEPKTEKQKKEEKEQRDKQRRHVLPDLKIPLKAVDSDVELLDLPELPPLSHFSETDCNRSRRLMRWTSESSSLSESSKPSSFMTALPVLVKDSKLTTLKCNDTSRSLTNDGASSPSQMSDVPTTVNTETSNVSCELHDERKQEKHKAKPKGSKLKTKRDEEEEEMQREMKGRKQEIRTMVQELDSGYRKMSKDMTDADLDPQFVHVQTLTKGQVFGLSELVLGRQTSLCVVSNGAECILLEKQYYRQHAPEDLIRRVRQEGKNDFFQCCPFPSDDEMQDGLQASVDWEAYKSITFRNTLLCLQEKRSLSPRNFRPSLTLTITTKKRRTKLPRPITR